MIRTLSKWVFFTLIVILGLILFLMVFLEVFISLPPGERFLKGIIQDQASRALEQDVRIGSIETDILSRVRVKNVSISQVRAGEVVPFLNLGQAVVRYDIIPLLRRKVLIRTINIRDMRVNVVTDSTGKTNIPLLNRPPSKEPSGPPSIGVEVQRIAISHSILRYRNQIIPLDVMATGTSGATTRHGNGYNFRVAADSVRLAYQKGKLDASRIRANGNWNDGLLRLDRVSLNFPGLTADGRRLAYRAGPDSLLAGRVELTGNPGAVLDFVRTVFSPGLPPMNGNIVLKADLGGNIHDPRIRADLTTPLLQVRDIRLQDGFVRASWANSTAKVDTLSLTALGGNLHGHGVFDTKTIHAENAALVFSGLDVKRLSQFFPGLSEYGGKASGNISGSGYLTDLDRLRANAQITVAAPVYQTRKIPDIALQASVLNGNILADAASGETRVTAEAVIKGRALNGSFTANVPRIADFAGLAGVEDLAGSLQARGTLGGALSSPEVQASLSGRSLSYKNFPVDSLDGGISWQNKTLSFSDLRVSGNLAAIENLRPPLHVDSLSGAAQYTGIINGPLTAPRADVSLHLEHPAYRGYEFANGSIRAAVRGDSVEIGQAVLESDSLRARASGALDYKTMRGSAELDVRSKTGEYPAGSGARLSAAFDVKNPSALSVTMRNGEISLPFIRVFAPAFPPMGGDLYFSGTFGGNLKNPDARIAFDIRKPSFESVFLDSLRGDLSLQNGVVTLQSAELLREDFRSVANASLTLEKTADFFTVTGNSPVRGTLTGDNLPLTFMQGLLPPTVKGISGTAGYDLAFDGTLSDPNPQGTINVSGFSMEQAGNGSFITGVDIQASIEDDTLALSAHNGQVLKRPFSIEALVNYTPPGFSGNIDLFYDGQKALNLNGTYARNQMDVAARIEDLNLSILRGFIPSLSTVSGSVNSSLMITGTLRSPQPNGVLKIHDLSLDFPGWDMPLRNGEVSLNISPNRVDVDTLLVKSRKGSIRATGYLSDFFTGSAKSELQATVNNVQVRKRNLADVTVSSAQLTLAGTGNDYLLSGNASLGETKILYDISIQSLVERLTTPPLPPPPPAPILKQVKLDILVNGGNRIYVQNSLANIRTRGDFEVIGTLASPNILGSATVVEGDVQYLDRKFTLTEGTVEFTNRTELNPTLNIQAETKVSTYSMFGSEPYKITLAVSGTMKAPTVKMTSDPSLEEPDIVSLLTLGVTRAQVGLGPAVSDTTTSLQNVLKQRAELLTSQRLAGYLGHEIGGLLGLQSLTVEGNLFNIYGEEGGPRIIASKQISPDVELTYITTLGRQSDQGIQVNYSVTDAITLRGQTDSQGRSGLDILYRLRFR